MTRDELRAALDLHRQIERLEAFSDDIRVSGGVGSIGAGERVSGGVGVFPGQVLAEHADLIAELKAELAEEQIIIRRYLERADLTDTERLIMIRRYVDCLTWSKVSALVGYSKPRAFSIHRGALDRLCKDDSR